METATMSPPPPTVIRAQAGVTALPPAEPWPLWQRILFRFFSVYLILQVAPWGLFRGIPGEPFLFETNVPGVFAAGDVRAGASRRVAAAVGDGSAAIYTIHRYINSV